MNSLLRRSLPFALVVSLLTGIAFAQEETPAGGDPFTNVQTVVCGVATAIQGPVGIAVGLLVLVAGLVAMQLANRDAIPMISRAVIGTALLIGASAAFAALIIDDGCA